MRRRWRGIWLCAIALILATCRPGQGGYTVSTVNLGGGLFQYNLTVQNTDLINLATGSPEPLSGVNLLNGNSVFGLDASSVINAPAGWFYFAPDPGPPLVDELDFFSLSPATDIPIGGQLGGFSFESMADPATLPSNAFAQDYIGGITGEQIPGIPEPASWILAISGILVVLAAQRVKGRLGGRKSLSGGK
jgi:hypothetical protein